MLAPDEAAGAGMTRYVRFSPEPSDLQERRLRNNPNNEPTGDYTGRCSKCGSKDLWDDNLHYGCNSCGAVFLSGH